ncbi:Hypothetical protein ZAZAV_189 [Cedratvirus Zaza IHUMI]|uniref:Uncharacterized protein n=1 Tax=Cedratvirus Zaza IHUMI TaxID=2126979 RepID=A0A2R8FE93_9VIRU|nr:Hypothetical protein ZAZAV_189 [Cedratvirus Zaza IHUMI]
MAQTLVQSVLKGYSYDKLKSLCFTEGSDFPLVFGCEWKVWRDKAVADFGISPQFFDLVRSFASNGIRTLSGPQRYLQISSYIKLTPLSGVRVYENGTIEGVYEAWKGYLEARNRKDPEMLLWFANRVKPEQQTGIRRNLLQKAQKTIDMWSEKEVKSRLLFHDYLAWLVKHDDIKTLDQVIHDYFDLPQGFSIERDVPEVPFWQIKDRYSALVDLPLQEYPEIELDNLTKAIMACSDTRIVDFFRSVLTDRLYNAVKNHPFAYKSLVLHGRPEQTYGIELRFFDPQETNRDYSYMAELVLNLISPDTLDATLLPLTGIVDATLLSDSAGDITYLTSVLPLFSKEVIQSAIERIDGRLYPLSKTILESYL